MKQKKTNLQSSAGIAKYDNENINSIKIKPQWILYFGFIIAIFILFISYFYGTWPKIH